MVEGGGGGAVGIGSHMDPDSGSIYRLIGRFLMPIMGLTI